MCYLNLSSNRLNDDSLNTALNCAPERSIILLEDIDALFVGRESVTKKRGKGEKVSFSGLLNALDGVRSQEGRILFMTTNHKEKLDPALMRPGRADFHALINYASYDQMKNMFLKFNPGEEDHAIQFARSLPEKKIVMAKLQGHFLAYKNQPKKQVKTSKELLDDSKSADEMTMLEWLHRLNITKYAKMFAKKRIYWVTDLRFYSDPRQWYGEFAGIAAEDNNRIMSLISPFGPKDK